MTEPQLNLRRVITGLSPDGKSTAIIDGPPAEVVDAGSSALYEIWRDHGEPVDVGDTTDRGKGPVTMMPDSGGMLVRWFTVTPVADRDDQAMLEAFGAGPVLVAGDQHPGMHKTKSVDMSIVVRGSVRVILEDGEVILRPGDAIVMRGTVHAWEALDGQPALCFCVVVDREIV